MSFILSFQSFTNYKAKKFEIDKETNVLKLNYKGGELIRSGCVNINFCVPVRSAFIVSMGILFAARLVHPAVHLHFCPKQILSYMT